MKKIFTLFTLFLLMMMGMADGQTHLWGTTVFGGTTDTGTIFRYDFNGNNFQHITSMQSATAACPWGALVLCNGKFYGIGTNGGCQDYGVCYTYEPSTGILTDIHDFGCDYIHGFSTSSGMTLGIDGKLYGLTMNGGAHYGGVIYRIDPVTNIYTDIYDFDTLTGYYAGGTVTQLSDGKLYGITQLGGANNGGVIFCFDPSNINYTVLHSFDTATSLSQYNGNGGLLKATDGKLYGLNYEGGPYNEGFIFSYDLSTSTYTEVYDFDTLNGGSPFGNLIQAINGLLYGMTMGGGAFGAGSIFSLDINNNAFTELFSFNSTDGALPDKGLMQASNGLLYGTAQNGGTTLNSGVFFSYNITTNTQTVIYNFDNGTDGGMPYSDIIEVADSLLNGINPIPNKESISIYPNPASTNLTINNLPLTNNDLRITDVLGNEVYHQAINNSTQSTINISNLNNGVYFYQLSNNHETYRGKFVKE